MKKKITVKDFRRAIKILKKNCYWSLGDGYTQGEDISQRYIISEIQLRKLFAKQFIIPKLDFNRDYVMEFIKEESLKQLKK